MKLYGHAMSTCTRKVLAVLAEKNHKADFVVLDFAKGDHKQPEHLARQPFGQMPTIDDDGFVLYESRAICRYLDETLPGTKLTPSNAKDRAMMEQWISVEQSNFTPAAMKVIFQAMFNPMFGKTPDEAIIKEGREGVGKAADVLDKHLAGKDFLLGKDFTLADICYLPYIEYLYATKNGDVIGDRKNVGAWWNRCSERKSWRIATGKDTSAAV
jgi:glutathione S-transferase